MENWHDFNALNKKAGKEIMTHLSHKDYFTVSEKNLVNLYAVSDTEKF